jgi:hypothetical protein
MRGCGGKTKTGAPCRAPAGPDGLCFFHAHPDLVRTLGQSGGRKNRSQLPESPCLEPLCGASLQEILSQAIREVRSRKMTPRNAAALAQLSNSLYRILPTVDLERRLAKIEQELADQARQKSVDPDSADSARPNETAERVAGSREEDRVEDSSEEGSS